MLTGTGRSTELCGWGRYPRALNSVSVPETIDEAAQSGANGSVIMRGEGRSYGDAAMLTDGLVMLGKRFNRLIRFDDQTQLLTAEAGVTIEEILRAFVSRGWFPPVTPGTKYVSLGGCVAADVHGKNHHRDGAFGAHVTQLELVLADGRHVCCSPDDNAELFWATVGGLGLTGIIAKVTIRLIPIESAFMVVQHQQARDVDASLEFMESREWDDQYTVAWIDCLAHGRGLGRGVFMRGHHAAPEELPRRLAAKPYAVKPQQRRNVPFDLPSSILNSKTMMAFNKLYYHLQGGKSAPFVSHYESFFFPLDRVGHWNRIYGRGGFVQYQFVLPLLHARAGLIELLEEMTRSRRPSFLSVLKRFGPEDQGLLSFPTEGYTMTLDIPVRDEGVFAFLDRLDEIVLKFGGRVYLAKDARLKANVFRAMYPHLAEWQLIKATVDPGNRFSSDLARRLGI